MPARKNNSADVMSLREYKAKRNFDETIEPPGEEKEAEKSGALFVIQKHAATRLHFDLRLEAEGVLKSWAVPKGLPQPGEKHLAILVEDHPLEYRHFEGVISPGNYGAGTVMIWDGGRYHLRDPKKNISKSLRDGEITFVLEGKKVRGEFTLVRFKKESKDWLLIASKAQKKGEIDEDVSAVSGKTMEEIASGVSEYNISEIPGARREKMPEFVKPMTAYLAEKPFSRKNWLFEVKWDGYRVIAVKKNKTVDLYSRNGKSFNEIFSSIRQSLEKIPGDFVLDGEVIAVDKKGKSNFQMLQNFLNERKGVLVYYVFDVPHLAGFNLENVKLRERKKILEKFLPELPNIKLSAYVKEAGEELFEAEKEKGAEGIIGKNVDGPYREGTRSHDWLKVKAVRRQEAVIVGFTAPRGGRKKFGALVLGVYEDGKLVYIGHTGGGFDEKTLDLVYSKLAPLSVKKSPFQDIPETNEPAVWVAPKLVAEVKFSEWTKDGAMRQPIFLGLREDKNPRDVVREAPIAESAGKKKFSVPAEGAARVIDGRTLTLTNLQKNFWPEDGYTKEDLINYYEKISKFILPYLADRPESLHRFPNGIHGEEFYQKDMPDLPDWIQSFEVYSDSEQRKINYLVCQDKATLIYLANLGCIEMNPWNSTVRNPENPDYMVFDIDPPEAGFPAAVEASQQIKKILDDIGLAAFCKTSGKRGIHIYVPTGAKYSFEQIKEFARLVSFLANRRMPERTSVERDPGKREGKVYLDFLQNRKGQTMAAPYSLRPRVGAPVSAPLEWKELDGNLNPADFSMKNIFERLEKKGDVWKKMFTMEADLEKALGELENLIEKRARKIK